MLNAPPPLPSSADPGLDVDAFAKAIASAAGMAADDLHAAAETWERAVDDALTRGEPALVIAFATTFAERRALLAPRPPPRPPPLPDACASLPSFLMAPRVPPIPITDTTLRLDNNESSEPALPT